MLRTSLSFLLIAIIACLAADINVTTLDPWLELERFGRGLLRPDFFSLPGFGRALFNTVSFALIGISLAVVIGSILSFFFENTPVRLICAFLRAIHELFWAIPRLIIIPLVIAFVFTSWEISLSLDNIVRFFTYDILPWPMRADGFYAGTQAVTLVPAKIFSWAGDILIKEALPGLWYTVLLTQIALVATALFTLATFPFANRKFYPAPVTKISHTLLIVLRTTPEYILAYLFLQLWGPSMLPAILALSLHNGAILAYLTSRNVNILKLPFDATSNRINRYFFEVLPRCYGQFLAFLFYRWEVIMRESAILGILGIATLGHYIDSAITRDHLDTAMLLITVTALVNMGIDTLSQVIRKRLKISAHMMIRKR
jgi:phosphonate transport system permease protein